MLNKNSKMTMPVYLVLGLTRVGNTNQCFARDITHVQLRDDGYVWVYHSDRNNSVGGFRLSKNHSLTSFTNEIGGLLRINRYTFVNPVALTVVGPVSDTEIACSVQGWPHPLSVAKARVKELKAAFNAKDHV